MTSEPPRRILLIRPSALGDVCRSVPVLASLRAAYPDATIDWLVQDSFADAVRHHPDLSSVVSFPRRELGRTSKRGNLLPSVAWMNQNLRPAKVNGGRYDMAVDAQGLFRSALFAKWTGAPRRIGYANAAEGGALFYTERYGVPKHHHAVDRMLNLVRASGIEPVRDMRLYAASDELDWIERQAWSESYAVLAPTSRWASKQWPADRFAELGRRLLGRGIRWLVIVGGPGEREQISHLLEWADGEPRAIDLVGTTSVGRVMAVIARSDLVVANDSASLHMAVGFNRPTVALFGPTRVGLVGPYQRGADVLQSTREGDVFDHKRGTGEMIARVSVEQVTRAALERVGHHR